ncbi:nucleoside/nucleotide kinase family protein, partial [Arthrobacter pigmenti]
RRGRHSPEGFWLDSYDYEALHRGVVEPLLPSGNGFYRTASFDPSRDMAIQPAPKQCAAEAIVIIEGMFLHRDELVDVWDYSLFLDVPFDETARRMAARDGSNPDPEHPSMRRYVGGQRIYFDMARPWERADLVIDNSASEPRAIKGTQSTPYR